MPLVEDFLSQKEEQEIIEAIRIAEKNTSGEIRVHLENQNNGNSETRAMELFHYLKMDNTRLQNGVLIYMAIDDKVFSIYGDKGINDIVGLDFWNSTKDIMAFYFKKGQFKQGLITGIIKIGEQLEIHFPWHHHDINELPNEISKG
jgi:uncharacterized membrane protein